MKTFLVKTSSSLDYCFQGNHFEIHEGVAYFYDENGDIIWVIKNWNSFFCTSSLPEKSLNPDEFYENIEKDEK